MITTTENKAGVGPEYLDDSGAGISKRIESLAQLQTLRMDASGFFFGAFKVADLVMQIERERTDAFRKGMGELKAMQQIAADINEKLISAESVVQDMTAIIAAKCDQERTLAEQIAQAICPMLDTDTSDMELPELVGALIDFALGEHARAQVMSMEPEDAAGVFVVLNADGRITGPFHNSDGDARAYINQVGRSSSQFMVARRIASCTTRIAADWKEG